MNIEARKLYACNETIAVCVILQEYHKELMDHDTSPNTRDKKGKDFDVYLTMYLTSELRESKDKIKYEKLKGVQTSTDWLLDHV